MNLVLIGYRGTGKSHVGRLLSLELLMPVVSLDKEIEREAGMTIPQIVDKHGWDWFRDLESTITNRVSKGNNQVIDAGGGVILREQNVASLRKNSVVFWLSASVEAIVDRIQHSVNRPSLVEGKTFLEEVEEVLKERLPLYKAAAHHQVDTNNLSPKQVASQVESIYKPG